MSTLRFIRFDCEAALDDGFRPTKDGAFIDCISIVVRPLNATAAAIVLLTENGLVSCGNVAKTGKTALPANPRIMFV